MLVKGEFQAKKLTKTVKDGKVYRKLWVKDEYDEDYEISFDESLISKLKKDGVYVGTFDYEQRDRYQGYGKDDRMVLVDVEEKKGDWKVAGSWDI